MRRRGFSLVHVFALVAVFSALSAGFYATHRDMHTHLARDRDRARARAVAAAAWACARRDLLAGRNPACPEIDVLDGRAEVRAVRRVKGVYDLELRARVESVFTGDGPGTLETRWTLRVRVSKGRLTVLSRREVGA